jgi:hypothetical protein
MDLYNLVTKIPYLIMLGIGITLILQMFLGGLQDLSADIDTVSQNEYKSVIVLERLLNLKRSNSEKAQPSEAPDYYDKRRAILPRAYFDKGTDDETGADPRPNRDGCGMNGLETLDGDKFAYQIGIKGISSGKWGEKTQDIECTTYVPTEPNHASSPALLISEDEPPLEVMIYVFPLEN